MGNQRHNLLDTFSIYSLGVFIGYFICLSSNNNTRNNYVTGALDRYTIPSTYLQQGIITGLVVWAFNVKALVRKKRLQL